METARKSTLGPMLVALGGVLILVSYFVHWGRVASTRGAGHIDVKGGALILGAAIVILLLGVALWVVAQGGGRLAAAIAAVVLGGLTLLVALTWALSKDQIRDTVADEQADKVGRSHESAERSFREAEDSGQIKTSTQPGAWIALGGGLLVLIGGIGGIAGARRETATRGTPGYPATPEGAPAPPIPGAAPQPAQQAGPDVPQGGGVGPGPAPPVPPDDPPIEGEPGTSPEFRP